MCRGDSMKREVILYYKKFGDLVLVGVDYKDVEWVGIWVTREWWDLVESKGLDRF